MKTLDPLLMLALTVVALFAATLGVVSFHEIPDKNRDLLNILLGVEATAFAGIVSYYFGSSTSSRQKDQTISALAAPVVAPAAPPAGQG